MSRFRSEPAYRGRRREYEATDTRPDIPAQRPTTATAPKRWPWWIVIASIVTAVVLSAFAYLTNSAKKIVTHKVTPSAKSTPTVTPTVKHRSVAPTPAPSPSKPPSGHKPYTPKHSSGEVNVQPGDNLWDLALQRYGNGEDWHKIYDANKAVIGSNPNLIRPGEHLVEP